MDNLLALSCRLACKDWLHEASLSFCAVLALASMLAPLLILHGVHNGVIEKLRERLLRDPAVLVLIPATGKGAGFDEAFITRMREAPGLRFGIGRTRDVASELQMEANGKYMMVPLEATGAGDPLLQEYEAPQPVSAPGRLEIVLSHSAAQRLGVTAGDTVSAGVGRRLSSGKFRRLRLDFVVKAVLPALAGARDAGFVDLPTLTAIQDFRDGMDVPLFGVEGELPVPETRYFESFRAYAASLDDVQALEEWFRGEGIEVKTRSREISAIKRIDTALASVISLIAAAGCAGFFAFMASTARAATRRKWKQMGMLKLIGFPVPSILLYPVTQALITGALGCALAFLIYGGVALAIDALFREDTGGEAICKISFLFFCGVFFAVQLLAVLASLRSALRASAISPSTAMRES